MKTAAGYVYTCTLAVIILCCSQQHVPIHFLDMHVFFLARIACSNIIPSAHAVSYTGHLLEREIYWSKCPEDLPYLTRLALTQS